MPPCCRQGLLAVELDGSRLKPLTKEPQYVFGANTVCCTSSLKSSQNTVYQSAISLTGHSGS
jgi:hypothetical protein